MLIDFDATSSATKIAERAARCVQFAETWTLQIGA
jgi:hypothetical protein